MSELKPCPFCGEPPVVQVDKRYPRMTEGSGLPVLAYAVVCNSYYCPIYHADNTWWTNKDTAIEAWNRRAYEKGTED